MTIKKQSVVACLIVFFLLFSFYPTIFELRHAASVTDPNREFILEHNYYWPDYNLYLSKIRQGQEGSWFPRERYTAEPHTGSLIQIFYALLGHLGQLLGTDPNGSYLLGRIILAPLLLLIVYTICSYYFISYRWKLLSFIVVIISGSFPKFITDANGSLHVIRYMEWWSNIDALQRITFIPHILFGQVGAFYLLYRLTLKKYNVSPTSFFCLVFLGNAVGIIFPPSLITLNSILLILAIYRGAQSYPKLQTQTAFWLAFIVCTLPSLGYLYIITQQLPWSALVEFHRTHPMLIPFQEYILGTGPAFFLGISGIIVAFIKKEERLLPMTLWVITTFFFTILFTNIQEQSPLRFTQTGLFIPLGILGTYLLHSLWEKIHRQTILAGISVAVLFFYIAENLFIMNNSLNWQTGWISQRLGANIPAVPYPPQAVYPLKNWMAGIRWLRDATNHDDIVLADITAGNYIPAYAGNTVYFGQANTVDYERKQQEVIRFFKGEMSSREAELLIKNNHIKYVFYSIQERDENGGKDLETIYQGLKSVFHNDQVTIYTTSSL